MLKHNVADLSSSVSVVGFRLAQVVVVQQVKLAMLPQKRVPQMELWDL